MGRERLKAGGRACIVDIEAAKDVRKFHKPREERGREYEWDGFAEEEVRAWFSEGFDEVEVERRSFRKRIHEGWSVPEKERDMEFSMLFASGRWIGGGAT